ncbi:MAG: helix-hairpin-helix domain-containing protein [Cyclobacteriaceae bacterium]
MYDLTKEDLAKLEGFKELSINNLLKGIEQSKEVPFEAVLFALGIRYVGKTVAEKLANYFKTMDALSTASYDALLEAPEVGEKIAESLVKFFKERHNQKEIERLQKAGLQFTLIEKELNKLSNSLDNKSFVISGVFKKYGRDELKELILAHGGRVLSGVSGALDYLLAGDNMGPAKRQKAEKLGVQIITEKEFEQML